MTAATYYNELRYSAAHRSAIRSSIIRVATTQRESLAVAAYEGTMAAGQRCLQRLSAGRAAFEHVAPEPPAVLGDRGRRARRPTLPP